VPSPDLILFIGFQKELSLPELVPEVVNLSIQKLHTFYDGFLLVSAKGHCFDKSCLSHKYILLATPDAAAD